MHFYRSFMLTAAAAAAALTVNAFAYAYAAGDIDTLKNRLASAAKGESVYIIANFTADEDFSIADGVELRPSAKTGARVSLGSGAVVENHGTIAEDAIDFSLISGGTVVNHGVMGLSRIRAGATVDNFGEITTRYGILIEGTLIMEKGCEELELEPVLEHRGDSVIEMRDGATLVNNSGKTIPVTLPDGSQIKVYSGRSYTALKAAAPTVKCERIGDGSYCLMTISCETPGAQMYYTVNGEIPTMNSIPYNGPVNVPASANVMAVARTTYGITSDTAYALGAIRSYEREAVKLGLAASEAQSVVPAPVASPRAGSYSFRQTVYLSCDSAGAVIYYTTDGSEPTEASAKYTGPFDVTATTTVRAKAVKFGCADSATASFNYNINGYTYIEPQYTGICDLDRFWENTVLRIKQANSGATVVTEAKNCPYVANSVMKALFEHPTVSLTVVCEDGSSVTVPAQKALDDYDSASRTWYSIVYLKEVFG